jgi:hypothetical protein
MRPCVRVCVCVCVCPGLTPWQHASRVDEPARVARCAMWRRAGVGTQRSLFVRMRGKRERASRVCVLIRRGRSAVRAAAAGGRRAVTCTLGRAGCLGSRLGTAAATATRVCQWQPSLGTCCAAQGSSWVCLLSALRVCACVLGHKLRGWHCNARATSHATTLLSRHSPAACAAAAAAITRAGWP